MDDITPQTQEDFNKKALLWKKMNEPAGSIIPSTPVVVGAGLDSASKPSAEDVKQSSQGLVEAGKNAAGTMAAGGSTGQTLTSAGLSLGLGSLGAASGTMLAGMGPAGAALAVGGLAISALENKSKAEAQHERDVIAEQENRKQAVQSAINQSISAARLLGV